MALQIPGGLFKQRDVRETNLEDITAGKVKRTQYGTISIPALSVTNTSTVTEVVPENSLLIFLGTVVNADSGTNMDDATARITLTNSTTITATRQGSGDDIVVSYCLVEFEEGIVKSTEEGLMNFTNTDFMIDYPINQVDTSKSMISYLGYTNTNTKDNYLYMIYWPSISFKNSTVLAGSMGVSERIGSVAFQVMEFN